MLPTKVVVIGDSGCGKTTLLRACIELQRKGKDKEQAEDTIRCPSCTCTCTSTSCSSGFEDSNGDASFDVYPVSVCDDPNASLLLFQDTPGSYTYDRLRPLAYAHTQVVLLCFSIDSPDSLHDILTRWTPELDLLGSHLRVPRLLVGCRADLRTDSRVVRELRLAGELPVSSDDADAVARRVGAVGYVECSARDGTGVDDLVHRVARVSGRLHEAGGRFRRRFGANLLRGLLLQMRRDVDGGRSASFAPCMNHHAMR
ncbi:unnamed protein product [Mycena citricolor]|uniref:Uncharacterized protein n=1 Tax=Mycena citricolor TaxID=2018698 RepID=A0AAD2JXZ1_9AGAR|nr:unnamed protein product [Mycena citricolor]